MSLLKQCMIQDLYSSHTLSALMFKKGKHLRTSLENEMWTQHLSSYETTASDLRNEIFLWSSESRYQFSSEMSRFIFSWRWFGDNNLWKPQRWTSAFIHIPGPCHVHCLNLKKLSMKCEKSMQASVKMCSGLILEINHNLLQTLWEFPA